jgi:hypothetical protein
VEKTTAARKNGPLTAPMKGNEYHDTEVPISFTLPSGWKVGQVMRFGEGENTAPLLDADDKLVASLYFKARPNPARSEDEAYNALLPGVEAKAAQRVSQGNADYRIRAGSITRRMVGGKTALSCLGDFTVGGVRTVEYLTWVAGDNAVGFFFGRTSFDVVGTLRQRVDPVIDTLKLP